MAIIQLIESRERDLGGFTVRRVLPADDRQMVGPFIFFDHLGPAKFAPGTGIDVRPHPHIALATVTYLFEGSLLHRDSLGSVREIRPGDVNWMTAGNGIAHSERTPPAARAAGERIHGIQSWVALPDGLEDVDPSFAHHPKAALPKRSLGGVDVTLIAGNAFGLESPVTTLWPTVYAELRLLPEASIEVPHDGAEHAVYVVQGELTVTASAGRTPAPDADGRVGAGRLAVLEPGAILQAQGAGNTVRAMLLGGAAFPTQRYIWWNFVASSQQRIQQAKERWRQGGFAAVPGETEFIPLPEH